MRGEGPNNVIEFQPRKKQEVRTYTPQEQMRWFFLTLANLVEQGKDVNPVKLRSTALIVYKALQEQNPQVFGDEGLKLVLQTCRQLEQNLKGADKITKLDGNGEKTAETPAGQYDGKEIQISAGILREVAKNPEAGLQLAAGVNAHEKAHKEHKHIEVDAPKDMEIGGERFSGRELKEGSTHAATRELIPEQYRAGSYEDMSSRLEKALDKVGMTMDDLNKAFKKNELEQFQAQATMNQLKLAA